MEITTIDTAACASRIIKDNPDLASTVLDLLIGATAPGFKDSLEYEEIKDLCWVRMQQCRAARDAHVESRAAA